MAFNRHRGADILEHWNRIQKTTNILLVHGPPYGILDRTQNGELVGCQDLLTTIEKRLPNLECCLFGHIHEAYGRIEKNGVQYLNSSICNLQYQPINDPQLLEI